MSWRIRNQLLAVFVVLIAVAAAIPSVLGLSASRDELIRSIDNDLYQLALSTSEVLERFAHDRAIDIRVISQADVLEGEDRAAKERYLVELLAENRYLSALEVVSNSGENISVGTHAWLSADEGEAANARLLAEARAGAQGNVFYGPLRLVGEHLVAAYATPVTDESNERVIAVIVATLALKILDDETDAIYERLKAHEYVYVIDERGRVLSSAGEDERLLPSQVLSERFLEKLREREDDRDSLRLVGQDGKALRVGHASLIPFPEDASSRWMVLAIADEAKVLRPVARLGRRALLSTLLVVGLGIAFALWIAARLSRPLVELEIATQRLAEGESDIAISKTGTTELQNVASAFHRMSDKLSGALARQRDLIADLEQKNSELERFTYTVSHDLRSPLITIAGFVGFLADDIKKGDEERWRRDIMRISNAVTHAQELLENLLELSRIGRVAEPASELSLGELAAEVCELLQAPIDEHEAHVRIDDDFPMVTVDATRLREVLQNLLENALKFRRPQEGPHIRIGWRQETSHPVFFVEDNGIGIETRHHDRIFGLFERLQTKGEGTGIGLALVKRIIEVHRGRVWIESEGEGRGTRVCFTLNEASSGEGEGAERAT